jgi:hypothetical protein
MKSVVVGVHLAREDVEPVADVIAAGDLWLSVVGVHDDQPLGDRDLLLRIAKVRRELLERATFVAVRYGFAVSSAAEALSKSAAHLERWKTLLEQHRGNVEMTLKVAATSSQPRPDRKQFASGAEYLKALHASAQSAQVDDAFREAAERVMNAGEHRWIHRDNNSIELAALVQRTGVDDVLAAGETLKRDFPRVAFLLSGPWPLEVFAS